jgi:hypothetical protein
MVAAFTSGRDWNDQRSVLVFVFVVALVVVKVHRFPLPFFFVLSIVCVWLSSP